MDEDGEVIEDVDARLELRALRPGIGDGRLHPVQWVTHNFLHYGFFHLAGNMLFLWAFGIVVEGKLGPVKYLLAYLAIGTLHGALVQTLLMSSGLDEHAAGASAVVYGLLAVCMVWAPRNELNCIAILLIGFRTLVFHWDLYYTTVALLYIGEQVFGLVFWGWLGGKVMVTEMGHLSGAFWGTVVAIVAAQGRAGRLRGVGPLLALGQAEEARQGLEKTGRAARARRRLLNGRSVKANARAKSSKRRSGRMATLGRVKRSARPRPCQRIRVADR